MKKILIFAMALLILGSCKDFLEEDRSTIMGADSDVIKTEKGIHSAMIGMYKPLSFTWRTGLGNSSTQGVCMGDDILTTHKAANKADFREFDQYNVTDINYRLQFIWDGAYKSIQGANLIIDNYRGAEGDQKEIRQMAGEAYFLRAYNYFWIARMWEKAPIVLHSQEFALEKMSIEPATQEELYTQIVNDLDSAINVMTYDVRLQNGRAGKASAIAILAEVYLHMAGYPLNKGDEYYQKAANTAKDLIDNKETYGLALLDDFAELWQGENDGNSEEVFALTFLGTADNWNGNALYGSANRPKDDGGWDDIMCELTFFNNYPDQYRKDVTFLTGILTKRKGKWVTMPWTDFLSARPYFKKFEGEENTWYGSQSLPLERFAEVYLIYAEAAFRTGDKTEAAEAVNTIRRRAYHEPLYTASVHDMDPATMTVDSILWEKAYEHAGEWVRWFDLVRTDKLAEANASKDPDDVQPIGTIGRDKYFFPVPATETEVNDNL